MKKIGITLGDPTGIGPEITKKSLDKFSSETIKIIYGALPVNFSFPALTKIDSPQKATYKNKLYWIPINTEQNFVCGKPSKKSGSIAYKTIKKAGLDAKRDKIAAIVTSPLSKKYVQLNRPEFIGHTEFFAKQVECNNFVMCFYSKKLIIALLTTHLALENIHNHLDYNSLMKKILLINSSVKKVKSISNPKIALLGLNPHSGENGSFGTVEIEIFKPLINTLKEEKININGPFPADTFFAGNYKNFDVIISAYHDQGLIPFKLLTFGEGVNITLGLPYVRTSVDHGTAFDIAGKNAANPGSMIEAIKLAERLI